MATSLYFPVLFWSPNPTHSAYRLYFGFLVHYHQIVWLILARTPHRGCAYSVFDPDSCECLSRRGTRGRTRESALSAAIPLYFLTPRPPILPSSKPTIYPLYPKKLYYAKSQKVIETTLIPYLSQRGGARHVAIPNRGTRPKVRLFHNTFPYPFNISRGPKIRKK